MLRICFIVLAVACVAAGIRISRAQDGETIINIMWVEEVDRTSPDPKKNIRVAYRMELRLGADAKII